MYASFDYNFLYQNSFRNVFALTHSTLNIVAHQMYRNAQNIKVDRILHIGNV